MTPEQERDRQKLARLIEREGFVARMNNTKWREAMAAISAIPGYIVRFRVKCVRDSEPEDDHWEVSFPWHVPEYREIEWLDLDPVNRAEGRFLRGPARDFSEEISGALRAVGATHVVGPRAIRIVGYTRPGGGLASR